MDGARRVMRADIVIRGDRIVAIEEPHRASRNGKLIDATGCAVVPGFIQAHVHLWIHPSARASLSGALSWNGR
jgi:dihydroorotase-like cyclic amidohydrolase